MNSTLTWLDADDAHRRRMLEVLQLFRDDGSVDELGVGAIRDAFSNALFPATSVLHTRARYLLFIPWLMRDVARHRWSAEKSRTELRALEVKLILSLLAVDAPSRGVIGNQAKARLKTMPSSLYWSALTKMDLIRWDASISSFFRRSAQLGRTIIDSSADDDAGPAADFGIHPDLPPTPADLLVSTDFVLGEQEAGFLRDRLAAMPGASLYSWLAVNGQPSQVTSIWEHPQLGQFDSRLRTYVDHARRFQRLAHGAAILYNLILAELLSTEGPTDLLEDYQDQLADWEAEMADERIMDGWEIEEFWAVVRALNSGITVATESFVTSWFQIVAEGRHRGQEARDLITAREIRLKGRRARITNSDARSRWTGASGLVRFDYRWNIARSHLDDIRAGLDGA